MEINPLLKTFDLNTTIIIPFYKKMKDFKRVLPINAILFGRNGIEVIISLDEPTEAEELLAFIQDYPEIKWKVIVNRQPHEWRNPSKALNVGIRHSTKKYIMVMSPECELYTDAIVQLKEECEANGRAFSVGRVAFVDYSFDTEIDKLDGFQLVFYGSIFTQKTFLEEVSGYTERYRIWGGEDDNIRAKLETKGIAKIEVDAAILIHREDEKNGFDKRVAKTSSLPKEHFDNSFKPEDEDFSCTDTWGYDFNEIIFDYTKIT